MRVYAPMCVFGIYHRSLALFLFFPSFFRSAMCTLFLVLSISSFSARSSNDFLFLMHPISVLWRCERETNYYAFSNELIEQYKAIFVCLTHAHWLTHTHTHIRNLHSAYNAFGISLRSFFFLSLSSILCVYITNDHLSRASIQSENVLVSSFQLTEHLSCCSSHSRTTTNK